MNNFIKKIATLKNVFGLLTIIFYFIYVGVNMYIGHGNKSINIILLILTSAYLLVYIYSVFIEYNKKVKKGAKKFFIGGENFWDFLMLVWLLPLFSVIRRILFGQYLQR